MYSTNVLIVYWGNTGKPWVCEGFCNKNITSVTPKSLVHTFVISCFVYFSLLFLSFILTLTPIQNPPAALIRWFYSLALPWLPWHPRIQQKLRVLTFKAKHNLASPYLYSLIYHHVSAHSLLLGCPLCLELELPQP